MDEVNKLKAKLESLLGKEVSPQHVLEMAIELAILQQTKACNHFSVKKKDRKYVLLSIDLTEGMDSIIAQDKCAYVMKKIRKQENIREEL